MTEILSVIFVELGAIVISLNKVHFLVLLLRTNPVNLLELSVYSAYKPISKNESFLLLLAKMIKESSTTKLLVLILATLPLILILPSILRSFKTDIVSLSKFANFDTVIYLAYICSNA